MSNDMKHIMKNWRSYSDTGIEKTVEKQLLKEELLQEGVMDVLKSIGDRISQVAQVPGKMKEFYNLIKTGQESVAQGLPKQLGKGWEEILNNPPPEIMKHLEPMIAAFNVGAVIVEEKKGQAALQEEIIYEGEEKGNKWNILRRIRAKNAALAARWAMWDILEAKLNSAESYEEAKEEWETTLKYGVRDSKDWIMAKEGLEEMAQDVIYNSISAEVEKIMGTVPPASLGRFLRAVTINATAEFIFGFFDNFVLVMVGTGIEDVLMQDFGLGTWVAASQANTTSDAGGGFFAKLNNYIKRYTTNPKDTAFSREISQNYPKWMRTVYNWSGLIGLILGCTVGSIPAFFMKSQGIAEQISKEKSASLISPN